MNTRGLVAVADVPCLLRHQGAERVDLWIKHRILNPVIVDGATYVRRAEVEPLRNSAHALRAELDAARAAGLSVLPNSTALALLVNAVGDARAARKA